MRELLDARKIVVCLGQGGAGKTTLCAALAVEGAAMGKRTLALTIDPSKRLVSSLGVSPMTHSVSRIDANVLKEAGFSPKADLDIGVLDVKTTFDYMIKKLAPSTEEGQKILTNRYYEGIADSLAGSHEYMAMYSLLSAFEGGGYDLIVVDTPPSEHLDDFLSAPKRLVNLLDANELRMMVRSYSFMERFSFGLSRMWSKMAFRVLEKVVGVDVLEDIWEFFMVMECVIEPLKERANKTYELLKSDETAFIMVSRPNEYSALRSYELLRKLKQTGYDIRYIFFNKCFDVETTDEASSAVDKITGIDEKLKAKLKKNLENYAYLSKSQRACIEELSASVKDGIKIASIPFMDGDVHDPQSLYRFAQLLRFGDFGD